MEANNSTLTKFDIYLMDSKTSLENDFITKEIIKQYFEKAELRNQWEKILSQNNTGNNNSKRKPTRKILLTAVAVMAIAACLVLLLWSTQVNQSPLEQLLAQHYEKPYTRDLLKGSSLDDEKSLNASDHYQNKNYESVIRILSPVINEPTAKDTDHFFLGLSYLYNDQAEQAIPQFESIINQESSLYSDSSKWYLSLALVSEGRYEEAKLILKEISLWTGNSGKLKLANDAQQLLNTLELDR